MPVRFPPPAPAFQTLTQYGLRPCGFCAPRYSCAWQALEAKLLESLAELERQSFAGQQATPPTSFWRHRHVVAWRDRFKARKILCGQRSLIVWHSRSLCVDRARSLRKDPAETMRSARGIGMAQRAHLLFFYRGRPKPTRPPTRHSQAYSMSMLQLRLIKDK